MQKKHANKLAATTALLTILALVLVIGALLCVPISAEEVTTLPPESTLIVTDGEQGTAAASEIKGQLALLVYDFWTFWFPSEWVTSFPDLFVLLTIVTTLTLLYGILVRPTVKLFRR